MIGEAQARRPRRGSRYPVEPALQAGLAGERTIRFDATHGFFLNGRPVKIKGTCNHQDHAGVGFAVPEGSATEDARALRDRLVRDALPALTVKANAGALALEARSDVE